VGRGGGHGQNDDRGSKVARWVSMQLQSHYVELLLWCGRKWKAPIKNAFNWRDYKWLLVDFFSFGPTNAGDNDHFIIHNKLVQSRD
jgi:hypothetical protein